MILSKQVSGELVQCLYNSSNILSSTYDKTSQKLTLLFKGGVPYTYEAVNFTDYTRFELAESQGVVFNSHIKNHPFVKGVMIDAAELLTEITRLKTTKDAPSQ